MWQELYDDLKDDDFIIIAVAMDSRDGAAQPWIDDAAPTYPCLIDSEHRLADLYNMVNVPQAVWIDEDGQIVRPTETAGVYEGFRHMDRSTGEMPTDVAARAAKSRQTYIAAIRDWVAKGAQSVHVYDAETARAHVPIADEDTALAHSTFRLGLHLLKAGNEDEGDRLLAEASRLHPQSWNMWRQRYRPDDRGIAVGPEFWDRVDGIGDGEYYPAVDMEGMPR